MKEVILGAILLLAIAVSQTALAQSGRPENTDSQSQDSPAYFEAHKEILNNYYQDRIMEERLSAQAQIKLLEVAENCFANCQTGLYEWAQLAEAVVAINDLERLHLRYRPFSFENAPGYLAEALSRIAIRKSQIIDDMEWQTARLDRIRKYETTKGLENLIKMRLTKPVETYGVVGGIIYSDKPVAFVDNTVLHPGESIHGVKVLTINKDSVEFERSGSTWTQKVGAKMEEKWK
ncbi:MAG: hypothetical protein P8016_05725 [Sedimentisphaerales bacterium]